MKAQTKLTREQILFISFMGVIGNIVYLHTWIDDAADRSAWLASMVGILLIIPLAVWILFLGKYQTNGTLLNVIESRIGKIPASIVYLSFFLINIIIGSTHLSMFTAMINTFFLTSTPSWAIIAFLLMIGFFISKGNIMNLGRFVEILAVLGLLNYFLTFVFSFSNDFNTKYIIPIFDTTVFDFFKSSLFIAGTAAETLIILMIFLCNIPAPEKHYRWVVKGIILAAVIFPLAIMIIIAMLSPELAKRIAYGGVNAARLIQMGDYVQGLEVFILIAYQLIAIGKVTISLFCAWTSIKDLFNNKIPRMLLLLTTVLMFASSVKIFSYSNAYNIAVFMASYIVLPFCFFMIIIAAICTKVKKN